MCLTAFFETSSLTLVWSPEQQHIFQDALTVRNDVTLYPRKSFCNWLYFSVCGSSIYTSKFVAHLTFTSPPRLLGNYHISILLRTPGSLFVSSLCFAPAPTFVSNFFVAEVIKLATIAGSNSPYIQTANHSAILPFVTNWRLMSKHRLGPLTFWPQPSFPDALRLHNIPSS